MLGRLLGYSFYDGNCGIALFLAALARVTNNAQFRDLALGTLQPLQSSLRTSDLKDISSFAKELGIGGATGIASIVYSLVKISEFLDLPSLLEDAQRLANLIAEELIASDRKFDIIGGGSRSNFRAIGTVSKNRKCSSF
ncbi:lanthionine synthetase LanC family protein, partial [Nostoc sp. 'Peltigera malacea cyanobiont' DB3992]|uniref:lanthionine synthetase LanC family protein n=1 Tax=Nostoc sp. 'Peltigera malacea cyanobiont' DB3992 TaxID=1206980 RepID=UPI000C05EB42